MPSRQAELPWTVHGDIACPLLTTERELAAGDVLWVDTGIMYAGYHSDFGRTWVVGQQPTARQQAQYEKWHEINEAITSVMRAGVTGRDLTQAAIDVCGGARPWMSHFYLGHGLGLDSAEMPFVGSDLGDEFDESLVLKPGMVLVLEPIVWDEGHSGYRSENVYVITDDGWINMTDYPYLPYGD
jgi:Xaa-Pro aminopeptidase